MKRILAIIALVAITLTGCASRTASRESLILATTTSTRDSGLLDVLVPLFEQQTGLTVKVIAVGSGQALELGRRGDADVLLTHAPAAEERFMADGHGATRQPVMTNDFVLAGPASDPASIRGTASIVEAFAAVAMKGAAFISRGDESGTHLKERAIWREAGIDPLGEWYVQAGTGMAEALRMADYKRAYTLSDRGTFLAQRSGLDLAVLSAPDPLLLNRYAVIVVNPAKHPRVNAAGARKFADFLLTPAVQEVIAQFGSDTFGEPLFFPADE